MLLTLQTLNHILSIKFRRQLECPLCRAQMEKIWHQFFLFTLFFYTTIYLIRSHSYVNHYIRKHVILVRSRNQNRVRFLNIYNTFKVRAFFCKINNFNDNQTKKNSLSTYRYPRSNQHSKDFKKHKKTKFRDPNKKNQFIYKHFQKIPLQKLKSTD